MAHAIVDLGAEPLREELTTEVCVIGSGAGGGTAARVLAEAGHEVVLLEEGGDYLGDALTRRDALYAALYQDGASRTTDDYGISVLQGRVLGGGTVINASDVVPAHPATLDHWAKKFQLPEFSAAALAPYQQLASEDLFENPIPEELASPTNRVLEAGSRKLGLRGEHMHHNRVGCIGLGKCMVGCAMNAKRNVRLVSIPKAIAAGCRVLTRARATRIAGAGAELKRVHGRALDARSGREVRDFTIRAKVVIVACNAINSAQLLLRSGIGNAHVGRHLTLQPQLFVFAVMPEALHAYRGIPQSYAVTEHEEHRDDLGLWGYRIEGIFATPGAIATALGRAGRFGQQIMARYHELAAALCLIPDLPSGEITLTRSGTPNIRYTPRADLHERMRAAARQAARIYLAAGATRVILPCVEGIEISSERELSRIDDMTLRPASASLVSAHQQGSVRFAASARDGAADPRGQVYGTRDVYVLDSSGYPSTASSHTMHPILATSHMLSARLAAELR
jgi:choline dehydrogenase-like flavoprotein